MDLKTRVGGILTAGYLAFWVVIALARWDELALMPLNSIGDTLAGIFAPLGFLWLVLGYRQQGEELQLNTQAIQLQATELRESVTQQKNMVSIADRELKARIDQQAQEERASQPLFVFTPKDVARSIESGSVWTFELSNAGGDCSALQFSTSEQVFAPFVKNLHHLARGTPVDFRLRGRAKVGDTDTLVVSYIDVRGRPVFGRWNLIVSADGALQINSAN